MSLLDFLAQPSTSDIRGALRSIPVRKGGILPLTEYGDGSARLDWTAGVPGSIMDAFTAPARAYRGEIAPDQMVPEGLNFAGSVALGSAAAPRPRGSVGMGSLKEGASHLDMSPEATPTVRGYHGASSSYEGDIYNPRRSQYRAFFAAESPELANNFARSYGDAPRVYPVGMELKKTFDASNPAHGDEIVNAFDKGGLFDRNYLMGSDTIRTMLRNGDAGLMEDPGVRRWLQRRGYDSWKFEDTAAPPGIDNRTSYGVLKPGRVRDLAGNVLFSNPETSSAPGLGLMAAAKQEPKGFTAYHGSPHDFDRFDMGKIGTGEGAQAYGHGLYFADSEGVARSYRDGLSDIGGGFKNLTRDENARVNYEAGQIEAGTATIDDMRRMWVNEIERRKSNLGEFFSEGDVREAQDRLAILNKAGDLVPSHSLGKMYQVRINADPDHFLDWDKPLSQQSEAVRGSVAKAGGGYLLDEVNPYNARDALEKLGSGRLRSGRPAREMMSEASNALRDAGIPGIKYLDQGSRAAGEGSRNYVVFDDKLIDILKKYGLLGMMGGGAALASGSRDANAKGLLP